MKLKHFSLIYFITGIFLYGSGFSIIFKLCKNDSWIAILIGGTISCIVLPIYKKILNKNNKFIKLINVLFILLINMIILRIFTTSFYLTKTPGLYITIPFIILCIYNVSKKIDTLTKETTILFFVSFFVILLNLIASTKTGSISFFFPINLVKKVNLLKGIIFYIIYTLSPFILLSNIKIDDKNYIKSFIFTNIFMIFISLIIIFVLGPNLISIYRFPEYMIFKEINLFGFIENVENLVGLIYFLNLFVTSSLCVYNIKSIVNKKYIFIILIAFIILLTELISDKYKCSFFIYKNLPIILLIFIVINIFIYILKKE